MLVETAVTRDQQHTQLEKLQESGAILKYPSLKADLKAPFAIVTNRFYE